MRGKVKQIPTGHPVLLALQLEMARLNGQRELCQALTNMIQTEFKLPDGATINPATGQVTYGPAAVP